MSVFGDINKTNTQNNFSNSNNRNFSAFTRRSDINHNLNAFDKLNNQSGTSKINSENLGYQPKHDTQSFRVNPMVFDRILSKTDIDKLEDDLAKEIQKKKSCSDE